MYYVFLKKLFVFDRKFLQSTVFGTPYMLLLKHINYERQVTFDVFGHFYITD